MIPGSGRSPGEGNGNPLQYSCLENSMGRGTWKATVHGITKESDTTDRLNSNSSKHSQIFYKNSVTLVPKPDKDATREESYRQLSLMIIDVKILNKILTNLISSTLKGSYTMIKWDLSLRCRGDSTYANQ